ncbi:UNVERIFIED_CONTAM: hypothetical protein K2H54_044360 [Gekko kuhli]
MGYFSRITTGKEQERRAEEKKKIMVILMACNEKEESKQRNVKLKLKAIQMAVKKSLSPRSLRLFAAAASGLQQLLLPLHPVP